MLHLISNDGEWRTLEECSNEGDYSTYETRCSMLSVLNTTVLLRGFDKRDPTFVMYGTTVDA